MKFPNSHNPSNVKRESIFHSLLLAIFFMSGFAAFLYQVIWQRLLTFFTGVDAYSVTLIVASFMAGLGLGNLAGGFFADRLSRRGNLILFALTQFFIALFGLVSKWLFYDVLYLRFYDLARSPLFLTGLPFLGLLWPTFFMGLSLPLLTKALCSRIESAVKMVGSLYGVNVLGSAFGSFVTAFFLFRAWGLAHSLYFGVLINFLCALGGFLLGYFLPPSQEEPISESRSLNGPSDFSRPKTNFFPFSTWLFIYALSGFIALSLEIIWFRLFNIILGSELFTFSYLLSVYLTGFSLGMLAVIRWANQTKYPVQFFFIFQSLVPLFAGLSLTMLVGNYDLFNPLWTYTAQDLPPALLTTLATVKGLFFGRPLPLEIKPYALLQRGLVYFVLPAISIGIPTFFMGASFPFLQKAVHQDLAFVGRRVGGLQAANILGSVLGCFLSGFYFLHVLGTSLTFKLLIALGGIFIFFFCKTFYPRRVFFKRLLYPSLGGLIVVCIILVPGLNVLWAKWHGTNYENILLTEDATGVSVLKSKNPNFTGAIVFYIKGQAEAEIPYHGIHILFGLFPSLLHPSPKKIVVIGIGSGNTLFSLGGRPETRSLTCLEISTSVLNALKLLDNRLRYRGLTQVLEDQRIRYLVSDGRAFLMGTQEKFDIIEADLTHCAAHAGNLYSYEYFLLLRERLNPGGFAVASAPTTRTIHTFLKVFPHVLYFEEAILIGSNEPIEFDKRKLRTRMNDRAIQQYFREAGVDLTPFRGALFRRPPIDLSHYDRSRLEDINTDLFPKDELRVEERGFQLME